VFSGQRIFITVTLPPNFKLSGDYKLKHLPTQFQLANNNNNVSLPPRHSNPPSLNNNFLPDQHEENVSQPLKFATSSARLTATIQATSNGTHKNGCLSPVVETNELVKANAFLNVRDLKLDKMNGKFFGVVAYRMFEYWVINFDTMVAIFGSGGNLQI
jgi:hypothetical protein